jgi:16S rRNA (guanine527-N7)-methyltransferase
MHSARIAELLQPFLSTVSNPWHSESGRRLGEACPERSRKPALSLSKGEPAVLSPTQLQHISTYIDILLRWNARIDLTAIRDPEEIVTRHFGESLFAARHLFPAPALSRQQEARDSYQGTASSRADNSPSDARALAPEGRARTNDRRRPLAWPELSDGTNIRLADLGSGAGFPGLPIKLWAPHISLTLIESNHKKVAFLREVARALTLTDINILNARAETLPAATFDIVTLRAVERFPNVLPVAATLLAPAGRLALLVASSQLDAIRSILPHFFWETPIPIPQSRSRLLLISQSAPLT